MAGAGAKNIYRNSVLVGNWNEDRWGADLAKRVADLDPKLETTSYRSNFGTDPTPFAEPSKPALRGFDALDGHLMMSHAPSADAIAARKDAPDRYVTITQSTMAGAPYKDVISGKLDVPIELGRREIIHDKARAHVVGIDAWDTDRKLLPRVPMTVTPKYGLAESIRAAPAEAPPQRHFLTAKERDLGLSATLAETTPDVRGTGHGRSFQFTSQFARGVQGLRT